MPGMGELMEGAMQQAPQPMQQDKDMDMTGSASEPLAQEVIDRIRIRPRTVPALECIRGLFHQHAQAVAEVARACRGGPALEVRGGGAVAEVVAGAVALQDRHGQVEAAADDADRGGVDDEVEALALEVVPVAGMA